MIPTTTSIGHPIYDQNATQAKRARPKTKESSEKARVHSPHSFVLTQKHSTWVRVHAASRLLRSKGIPTAGPLRRHTILSAAIPVTFTPAAPSRLPCRRWLFARGSLAVAGEVLSSHASMSPPLCPSLSHRLSLSYLCFAFLLRLALSKNYMLTCLLNCMLIWMVQTCSDWCWWHVVKIL